jgi:TP901 family phage tail tape measure protein
MAANNVNIKLGADVKDFTSKMKIVARQFKRTARNLKRTGKTLTRNLTGPIAALGTGAVMAAANFQKSMNKVRAITGATGKDFKKLDAQAKQLGKNTQFSASQAADAMSFLGMAGFKTEEIMSAMPATLDLAAAGSMDLAQAADIASNVISGFGAEASDLGKFSDVMAKAMTSSNTSLEQLGGAMKLVAPVYKGFGISMEETTAAIGKLSDAGIQGESAGTGLRGILATLSEKAGQLGMNVFDAAGNMRPLNEILTEIEGKGHSTATIMEVFGKKAGPSMLALLNVGGEGLKNFTTELENSGGTAKRIADTQMEGLAGSLTRLKSATEGLAISFGEIIIPVIEKCHLYKI